VVIPATVTYVGPGAYGGNGNLKSVTFAGAPPVSTGNYLQYPGFWAADSITPSFGNTANVAVYFTPEFAAPGFAGGFTAPVWEGYHAGVAPVVVGQFTYEKVSDTEVALVGNTLVAPTQITIPSSVTIGGTDYIVASIGFGAFANVSTLTAVTIPASVTRVGQRVFSGNPLLTSVTFVGAPPTTITAAGALASLGTAVGLTVHFSPEFLAPSFVGGFTMPWWQGYVTGAIPFEETPTPTISGTTTVGQTLSADAGTWSPVADSLAYQWKRGGVEIDAATASTYGVQAADAGRVISVTVTAMKSGYATTSRISVGTAPINRLFALTAVPTVSGAAVVGQRLTVATGSWSPAAAFSFVWKRNGTPISGGVGAGYTVSAADLDARITVDVTAYRTGYDTVVQATAQTSPVALAQFVSPPVPTISGTAAVGQRLTAVTGSYSAAPAFSYIWKRGGVAISGAVGATYGIVFGDVDAKITVTVTASRNGFTSVVQTTTETDSVARVPFTTAPTPTISGTARVGQRLSANAGAWSPLSGITYAWKRGGVIIPGATSSSYVLGVADADATITVAVIGSRAGYLPTVKASAATTTVARIPLSATSVPTISGSAVVGQRLTALTGSYTPAAAFSFVWKRNGNVIGGGIGAGYTVAAADVEARITVEVTAYRTGYISVVQTTAATATVTRATFSSSSPPVISGTPIVGQRLTVPSGSFAPAAAFSYVWKRGGTPIRGGVGAGYTVVAADLNSTITVEVTAYRGGYISVVQTTPETAPVSLAAFVATSVPTISGSAVVGQRLIVATGSFTPAAAFNYVWKRGGVVIFGGVGAGYTVAAADLNSTITVEVTAYRAGYTSVVQTTAETLPVTRAAFVSPPVPTISGSAVVGQRLTAVTGTYSAAPAFSYVWKRNGVAISGAVGAGYTPSAADVGKKLTLVVTTYRNGFTSVVQTTNETATVTR
jgi:hypothetical protein